jgi:hypothetical protein
MEFGQIIKKAWTITWRYRFLWVLALFAGVTGPGGGSGFSSGRSFGSGSGSTSTSTSPFSAGGLQHLGSTLLTWIPVLIAVGLFMILIGLLIWVLSIAARGSLIWAVNELEEGRRPSLGAAWGQGFSRFWSIFGLGLLLQLPVVLAVVLLAFAIGMPIVLAITHGGPGAAAAIVPVCGSLAIGIPLVIVLGFVLGIMYVIGLRRIVLDGVGAIQSAGDAWRTFRHRFKDTALMWIINWGLNIAAGLVIAIPIVILTLVFLVPAIFAGVGGSWGAFVAIAGVWFFVVIVISLLYTAIWGTFTSALWTILYRRLTGREIVVPSRPHAAPSGPTGPAAPSYPAAGGYAAPPPPGYVAPPVQGWAPPQQQAPPPAPPAEPASPAAPAPPEQPLA